MSDKPTVDESRTSEPGDISASSTETTEVVNWSEELEELHEESSRDHFLDRYTRSVVLASVESTCCRQGTVLDAGCSSGYLLADLKLIRPDLQLVGVDLVASGLRRAKSLVPSAELLLADVCDLPIADSAVEAVVSCNLLEHVPDDERALQEFYRVLRPGGRAAIVVPAGPGVYDYYDRFLSHERRYARHEMARKARGAGFRVLTDTFLGTLLFPAFWLVKKRNRRIHPNPGAEEIQRLVEADISKTSDSLLGRGSTALEARLLKLGVAMPFGIRSFVVLKKPS